MRMRIRENWMGFLLIAMILFVEFLLFMPQKPVHAQLNGTVQSGQQAVTATAAQITGSGAGTMCIKALAGNGINVYIGGPGVTDSTGMELAAGNAYCAPTSHANQFYVVASITGASVSWIVSN